MHNKMESGSGRMLLLPLSCAQKCFPYELAVRTDDDYDLIFCR